VWGWSGGGGIGGGGGGGGGRMMVAGPTVSEGEPANEVIVAGQRPARPAVSVSNARLIVPILVILRNLRRVIVRGREVTRYSIGPHIRSQLRRRGWTEEDVADALQNPAEVRPGLRDTRNTGAGSRMNDQATGYVSRRGGYVIRNDRTGDTVQVSNRLDPGWRPPW
jgi:hypothetical protein